MGQQFSKPYKSFEGNIRVQFDFSKYARKLDLNKAIRIDTSKSAAKSDLANLNRQSRCRQIKDCSY